jgi:multidrug efflux pump subunit AcrA (membrane-fusion protein)
MEKRPAWLLVVVQLIIAIAICGCGHKEEAAPDSIPVTVQAAAVASGVVGGAYSANIVADTQVDVAFKVNGYVQSILQMKGADGKPRNVQAGDSVTTGTVLAVVKDDTYRNTLIKSQADLQNSRASLSKAQADF